MTPRKTPHVYGPVPSRRLGRSLGLDLVPFKTCPYDCIYCQLGPTTHLTLERADYVPAEILVAECRDALKTTSKPDYICLAGSGEPTLNSAVGEVIRGIKKAAEIPVAVLTNGALLWHTEVQEALLAADLVMPSLDAGDAAMFQRINRPHPELAYARMVEGLAAFTRRFAGDVWLEVLLVAGMNGVPGEVAKIAAQVDRIQPARVQLNTVCRPPAEADARPLPGDALGRLADSLAVPVDIIGRVPPDAPPEAPAGESLSADIRAMIARRPCTAQDVARGLGVHLNEVLKHLGSLVATRQLAKVVKDQQTFFIAPLNGDRRHDAAPGDDHHPR
jgi:wyosine [tRNA(Phe)-imidazoG37] synthetase (radical SAM superfamily)